MMNSILELEKIPEEVKNEIAQHYKYTLFDKYNADISVQCITRKIKYQEVLEEDITMEILDDSIEPVVCLHMDRLRSFLVRGEPSKDTLLVYAVLEYEDWANH